LEVLISLHDRVSVRLSVNGRLGPTMATHRGTRQGSELSPLLFGLFMDLLHELIKLQVPGSGPVIGGLKAPALMYADDVTMHARLGPRHFTETVELIVTVLHVVHYDCQIEEKACGCFPAAR
jgi:hypothetical protein